MTVDPLIDGRTVETVVGPPLNRRRRMVTHTATCSCGHVEIIVATDRQHVAFSAHDCRDSK